MEGRCVFIGCVLAALLAGGASRAQAPADPGGVSTGRVIGEVLGLDPAGRQITVKNDAGGTATVTLEGQTVYWRVPPGEKDLGKAVRITLADLGVGDRIYARGVPASSVIVMSRADLAQQRERERAEWQKRGAGGVITALNPESKQVTIRTSSRGGAATMVVETGGSVTFRRYAPDSVRFSDARPSSFAELRIGDQVRVLGNRDTDGMRIAAEQIVSGAFRNVAGTILSLNAAGGEIRIRDLESRRPLTVRVNSDSMLRRIPPMMATMLAGRASQRAAGTNGGIDFQQVLERMPALSLGELKRGDAIIVSSTAGAEPSRLTAIVLLGGVEALLASAPQGERLMGGTWNLDIGLP